MNDQSGVVIFDPEAFKLRYPAFAGMPNSLATAFFDESTLFLNNTGCSPVINLGQRSALLNMLTAHIAQINYGINGEPPSPIVGRINQASEGTVSVSAEMGPASVNSAWYMQTPYGAAYWTATAAFRTAHYLPGRSFNPSNQVGWNNGFGPWGNRW